MEDVETKKNGAGWNGFNLAEIFLKNSVSDHIPRKLTGEWRTPQLPGNVMCVHLSYTLPQAFRRLSSENFLACPVLDGHKYVGMITMLNLVEHTCKMFWGESQQEWVDFWNKSETFQNTLISDVMAKPSLSNRDPSPTLLPDSTSLLALELFARTDTQRCAIVHPKSKRVTNILTQSMLVSFIRQNQKLIAGLLQKKVQDISAPTMLQRTDPTYEGTPATFNMVHSVKETDRAINAFNKMVSENVSAVAIVDAEGVLTGSISIRDLRGVGTDGEKFHRLFSTVQEFKRKVREEYPRQAPFTHYSTRMVPHGGYFVEPTEPLQTVLDIMNDGNIHRVYVCSSASVAAARPVPVGVISLRDFLMEVYMHVQSVSLPPAQAPAIVVD